MLIKYNRDGIHHAGAMRLLPGLNEVDEKQFAEAETWPAFKALIDEGIVEPVLTKKAKPADLTKMPVREVIDLVKQTVSKEMLEEMLKAEKREPVIKAIEAQLEAIDPSKPKA
jgi:hypothetical protein